MADSTMRAPSLADWALSRGLSAFTTDELADALAVPADQVRRRLHAPTRRHEWVSPARGLWMPVSPEHRTWGAPPGLDVIDRLADHLRFSYYVGWLSAAALHGAAHQAPQVFQVAVPRQVRDRAVGRTRFQFRRRNHVEAVATQPWPTRSGDARVSTPEVTALDVAADAAIAGGIDNAATVMVELGEGEAFSVDRLVSAAPQFPVAAVRRLGWVLETLGERDDMEPLHEAALQGPGTPARLDPSGDLVGPLDVRWNVRVNRDVEPDL